jgi:two-component system, NtrC family, sensor kinase
MARLSERGGRVRKAKARRVGQAKGHSTAKTSPNDRQPRNSGRETEVARLKRELNEALARQIATSEVLKVISRSAFDLDTVMNTLTRSAAELCSAEASALHLRECDLLVVRGVAAANEAQEGFLRQNPIPINQQSHSGRAVLTGSIANIGDVERDQTSTVLQQFRTTIRYRALLLVPLMRDGRAFGLFSLSRNRVGEFSEREVQLVQTFADQAVIAIENTRLFNETKETLERQTATAEILKVIASSPSDVQPVFEAIVNSAAKLFQPCGATITILDDGKLHWRATASLLPDFEIERSTAAVYPIPFEPIQSPSARAILERRIIEIPDIAAPDTPELTRKAGTAAGFRSATFVPLINQDQGIGSIVLIHPQAGFKLSEKQLSLVQTFADQAVIAIQNTRLFDEVQAKTRDLTEALTYQTGSGNILKVIASSPTDVAPVLSAIVESACELCDAVDALVLLKDGDSLRASAHRGPIPLDMERWPIRRNWVAGRAFLDQTPVHVHDLLSAEGDEFPDTRQRTARTGTRSILSVPLLREGESIGAIVLRRTEVHPFSDKQIALLQTFADQAVIAIENVRLFDEVQGRTRDLTEALTYQTGSANILRVIASSPTDVGPVLQAIVESACELCDAKDAVLLLQDGDDLRFSAHHGPLEFILDKVPISRSLTAGRAFLDREPVHVHDILSAEGDEFSEGQRVSRRLGTRTILNVPLLREGESIGTILLRRTEVHAFSDKQIALLQTFADQAVIAIQNARLFDEVQTKTRDLEESLQQQTATAEVLKAISRSAFDLESVLTTLTVSAKSLCGAASGVIYRREGNLYRYAASHMDVDPAYRAHEQQVAIQADRGTLIGRVALEKGAVQIADAWTDPDYEEKDEARLGNVRAMLGVPLMLGGEPIGAFALARREPMPFSQREVELVTTFADQAVIAIENARLFDEVQRRTRELSLSLEELRTAQDRLVQTEKLASLGQLTAGIAHEIKNPLNFVNNFSALSIELIEELKDVVNLGHFDGDAVRQAEELTGLLKSNLEKVVQHGKRADSIVKNMLLHSRQGSGEHRPVDINAIVDESLNLAYHGARAENTGFNITMHRSFDPAVGMADGYPQEITRALLNLISNGFYAATKRKADAADGFEPTLTATTKDLGDKVEIRIRDNGTGIPAEVKEKIFNPFFTTKPAGEGTGLGLSMSHDIIVKQHGGTMDVDTVPGVFTEFKIVLPRAGAFLVKPGERP